jgi:hypothetical protein
VHVAGISIFFLALLVAGANNWLGVQFASWAFMACLLVTGALMSCFSIPFLYKGAKPVIS